MVEIHVHSWKFSIQDISECREVRRVFVIKGPNLDSLT